MSLLAVSAIISAAAALTKTGIGQYNLWKGKKELRELERERPMFETPDSVGRMVGIAEKETQQGMAAKDIYEQDVMGATSRGIRYAESVAGSGVDLLSSVSNLYSQELESLNKISLQDLMYRESASQRLQEALGMQAGYEEKAFEYNEWLPWQAKMNRASERAGMGRSMTYEGIGDTFGVAGNYMLWEYQMSELQKLYGSGDGGFKLDPRIFDKKTIGDVGGGDVLDVAGNWKRWQTK